MYVCSMRYGLLIFNKYGKFDELCYEFNKDTIHTILQYVNILKFV